MQIDRLAIIERLRKASIDAWTDSRYHTTLNKMVEHICEETAEALIAEFNKALSGLSEKAASPKPKKEVA